MIPHLPIVHQLSGFFVVMSSYYFIFANTFYCKHLWDRKNAINSCEEEPENDDTLVLVRKNENHI